VPNIEASRIHRRQARTCGGFSFSTGHRTARSLRDSFMNKPRAVIAGGGAAGFFGAITCAEVNPEMEVVLLEASPALLAKVKISGGGRCNVTHACFEPRDLVKRYPRGGRELLGAFHRWQPRDTVNWFEARGVALKTESDGRMFPASDDSQTIIDCLHRAAQKAGVQIRTRCGLTTVAANADSPRFTLTLSTGETLTCDRLLLATGGPKVTNAPTLAAQFGHTVEAPVPSLFTFNIADPRLRDLAGLSVAETVATVRGTKLRETGPLLITHWGVSGPAILKLSAWGARELHACNYQFTLIINWLAGKSLDQTRNDLATARTTYPRRQVSTASPFAAIPQRLWERLTAAAGLAPDAIWTGVSNDKLAALAAQLTAAEFVVTGKSTNKDEFVTCGGVRLSEVDFKTMESRLVPGLHFAGEALDIDGLTGGFNFQAAWTTGRLAGLAMSANH
jgi:predicted Rossmann fold flavoprotein